MKNSPKITQRKKLLTAIYHFMRLVKISTQLPAKARAISIISARTSIIEKLPKLTEVKNVHPERKRNVNF